MPRRSRISSSILHHLTLNWWYDQCVISYYIATTILHYNLCEINCCCKTYADLSTIIGSLCVPVGVGHLFKTMIFPGLMDSSGCESQVESQYDREGHAAFDSSSITALCSNIRQLWQVMPRCVITCPFTLLDCARCQTCISYSWSTRHYERSYNSIPSS